ncbi:MAG TPA: DMT family transporter [Nitrospiria bacterium]
MKAGSQRLALIALFAGAGGIAFAPIFVRLSEVGPAATAFYRMLLALPIFWLWSALEKTGEGTIRRPSSFHDYSGLVAAGLLFAADLAVWHYSLAFTSVANATLLANFQPVWVTLGAWILFRDRVSPVFLVGLALALGGAAVLMGESFVFNKRNLIGDLLGLLTALFFAGYFLTVSRLRSRFSTATIMAWSGTVSALALWPVVDLLGENALPVTMKGWMVLAGLAVISHGIGQSLIAYALAHLPAAFSSVGLLLQPVGAAALAWIILAEPLSGWQWLGGLIVLSGIYLARRGSL